MRTMIFVTTVCFALLARGQPNPIAPIKEAPAPSGVSDSRKVPQCTSRPAAADPLDVAYQQVKSATALLDSALATEAEKANELKIASAVREKAQTDKEQAEASFSNEWNKRHKPLPPPTPPNPVPPGPAPPSPPAPITTIKAGRMWVICMVDNVATISEDIASIEKSAALRNLIASNQNHLYWFDANTVMPGTAKYLTRAKADGLPRGYILDADKTDNDMIVESFPLTTEADVIQRVQKYCPAPNELAPKNLGDEQPQFTIVGLTASWCGPCQAMHGLWKKLGARIVDIDTGDMRPYGGRPEKIPLTLVYKNNKLIASIQGGTDEYTIRSTMK